MKCFFKCWMKIERTCSQERSTRQDVHLLLWRKKNTCPGWHPTDNDPMNAEPCCWWFAKTANDGPRPAHRQIEVYHFLEDLHCPTATRDWSLLTTVGCGEVATVLIHLYFNRKFYLADLAEATGLSIKLTSEWNVIWELSKCFISGVVTPRPCSNA